MVLFLILVYRSAYYLKLNLYNFICRKTTRVKAEVYLTLMVLYF